MANQGWVCPRCDRVFAPHVDECGHCNYHIHSVGGEWTVTLGAVKVEDADCVCDTYNPGQCQATRHKSIKSEGWEKKCDCHGLGPCDSEECQYQGFGW